MYPPVHIPVAAPATDLAANPRDPWGAVLLSLFAPGLGHVYAGRARRGLRFAIGGAALIVAAVKLSMVVPYPLLRPLFLAVALVPLPVTIVDAFRVASRADRGYRLKRYNRWYVYLAIALVAMLAFQPFIYEMTVGNVARAFRIPSTGMEPALIPGDYILSAPIGDARITRGMPVIYESVEGMNVHRVVALPGETVEMRRKVLYIGGRAQREPYAHHIDPASDPTDPRMMRQTDFLASPNPAYKPSRDGWGPLVVPPDEYLLLGDNRDNSEDGRYLGFVPREQITGRPVWIYLSRDAVAGAYRWGHIGHAVR